MAKLYYAYIHYIKERGVFYVGKGTKKRANETNSNRRNPHYNNVVNKYSPSCVQVGLLECSSENIAFTLEVGLIKCLRRMGVKLTNKTDGGEGSSGYKMTEAEKAVLSKRMKGNKLSLSTKQKIAEKLQGNTNSAGRIFSHSAESKVKMSSSQKERFKLNPVSDVTKKKMSEERYTRVYLEVECPHCGKVGKSTGMRSWHFDYCEKNINKKRRN